MNFCFLHSSGIAIIQKETGAGAEANARQKGAGAGAGAGGKAGAGTGAGTGVGEGVAANTTLIVAECWLMPDPGIEGPMTSVGPPRA